METFSFDVPLLDPTGDFSGPEVGLGVWDVEGAEADVCGREAAKGCFDLHYLWCSSKGPGIRSAAVANLGQLAVPNLGPRGGPKFGTAGTKNIKAGPKLSPSDGARFGPSI